MSETGGRTGRRVVVSAPAKLNLHLEVLRRRSDGYHEIETILQAVDVRDRVEVSLVDARRGGAPDIELGVRGAAELPEDRDNLAWQAVELFCRHLGVSGRLQIVIEKRIPTGAGLGGGSSDAMAVLAACNRLFASDLGDDDLEALGAEIGSDVP